MKLIIEIDEDDYTMCQILAKEMCDTRMKLTDNLKYAISNGIPLPEGHGRLGDLDEAIRHAEEVAEEQDKRVPYKIYDDDEWTDEQENCHKCAVEHRQLARWLKDYKRLLEQPKWIPVSERLPELNRPLLVTAYHRVYYGHLISESGNYGYPVFRIHGLGDKDRNWVQETMSHEPYSLGRIDAWMYLDIPEPYKPQESDHTCHTCKHYTSGERDGSCGSYICKGYSDWESEE